MEIDKNVIEKIITSAGVTKDDTVIEIGPGIGNMTQYLSTYAKRVLAIEIDRDLVKILKEDTLSECDNAEVIGEDFMRLELDDLLIVTADHGNDPTFKGFNHTRE